MSTHRGQPDDAGSCGCSCCGTGCIGMVAVAGLASLVIVGLVKGAKR